MGHLPMLGVPFKCICDDIEGPLNPMSSRGYRQVLTVEFSTSYPQARPLKAIRTEEVAEALFGVYCLIGYAQIEQVRLFLI